MRDPEGALSFQRDTVTRTLHSADSPSARFLRSGLARSMVDAGQLVAFELRSERVVESPRLPFVSYPFEWCDAQLRAAGALTLALAKQALPEQQELKDASAWNVLFDGARPVFCDHLSFQPITRPQWWAFGQFARHFVFPLTVSSVRGQRGYQSFTLYRDGLPPDRARELLGWRRFRSRAWPLLLRSGRGGSEAETIGSAAPNPGKTFHAGLYAYCDGLLGPRRKPATASAWSHYTETRSHYETSTSRHKLECVDRWLAQTRPGWVADLGCNTGEFSRVAAARGAQVIAIDYDHDSIEQLFLGLDAGSRIHPLIANLGDLPAGRGWSGTEFPGLSQRLDKRVDVVMMLALVHHLAISEGIPLPEIARAASRLTRAHCIVEFIDHDDPMVVRLSAQRGKPAGAFTIDAQLSAFGECFEVLERVDLPQAHRALFLLRAKA